MRIKKYVVNSIPDALEKIKTELGQNAVILNTKKIKTGGFLGWFAKQQIEVIAAVDQEKTGASKLSQPKVSQPEISSRQTSSNAKVTSTSLNEPSQINNELMNEIKHMKHFMLQMITQHQDKLPLIIQEIDHRLAEQQVSSQIRSELLSKLMLKLENEAASTEDILDLARAELGLYLQRMEATKKGSDPKLISFIGPTGVGKTTTIAKLAANYILKQKKKVGFITTDTYRIAAVEQLKTYGHILNIPTEVIFTPDELQAAMGRLSECDIIFLDTAGRNYLQQKYVEELEHLLPKDEKVQINLVLSLTSKPEDMRRIIQNFASLEVNGLILTKLDETYSYGMLINLLEQYSYPLTYVTNGQNVPDDILEVTPKLIIDLILGEGTHERSS